MAWYLNHKFSTLLIRAKDEMIQGQYNGYHWSISMNESSKYQHQQDIMVLHYRSLLLCHCHVPNRYFPRFGNMSSGALYWDL